MYGNTQIEMPNLNRLAEQSNVCENKGKLAAKSANNQGID